MMAELTTEIEFWPADEVKKLSRGGNGMSVKPILKPFVDKNGIHDGINAIGFFPAERVNEIFSRMEAAWDTDNEAVELRIFYQRMRRVKKHFSYPSQTWLDVDDIEEGLEMRLTALGEAVEDAEFVAAITGTNHEA
jgi:hypothetical protein